MDPDTRAPIPEEFLSSFWMLAIFSTCSYRHQEFPRPREGSGRNEKEVIFSAIESEIFIHNVGGHTSIPIKAKIKPKTIGFAWMSIKFGKPGNYHIRLLNTGDNRVRWIQVIVRGERSDGEDFAYRTKSGIESIEAGLIGALQGARTST